MNYVLIPVYINSNRLINIVRNCLNTYWENSHNSKLVIVDDCSPLKIPLDASTVLSTDKNKGYTGCVNTGLEYILKKSKDEDTVCVVNNDVEFPQDWEELVDYLTDDVGVVSPLVSDEPYMVGEDVKFGSFWCIKVKTLRKVGILDESMSAFFSDTDLYKRIKDAGLRVFKTGDIRIPHLGNQTYGDIDNREELYSKDMESFRVKHGEIL